ncbi:hypothetical protein BDFB_009831 [Asbolus verrucosus]|uniref:DUF4817 domain-containing protein n=1 Tax=Asbolus verrucosus TaxID=1661398 RepID=A0A482VCP8_ASBVE|nr:hypothetical protein BDFB_009831 [Asbolus verrucosus]
MTFSQQQKIFIVEAYLRSGRKVEGVCEYSISPIEEFRTEFPEMLFEYEKFRQTLDLCVSNFQENGSVARKKEVVNQKKKRTAEVTENVRQIMEAAPSSSLRHLSQQVDLSVGNISAVRYREEILTPFFNNSLMTSCFLGTFNGMVPRVTQLELQLII